MTFRLLTLLAFSASASAADLLPFLRLPRLAQAPTIDGRLASGEWDHAAATAGFSCFDLGWALAPPWLQTTVWLGWDESNLYLAMRAPYGGAPLQARTFQDDSDTIFLDDHLEWQILPSADRTLARRDDGGFFKFMVNPHGAVLDQRMEGAKPVISSTWAAHAEVRSAMQDGAWVIEMRVPVAAIGTLPVAGQSWIMQIMRTGGGSAFHCAWAPGGWLEWHRFPEVAFVASGSTLQVLSVTATDEVLEIDSALTAPAERPVTALARLRLSDSDLVIERPMTAAAGMRTTTTLRFDGLPPINGEQTYELSVNDGDTLLGRWNWSSFPADDPELLDLRETWDRQRRTCGLLGTVAQITTISRPLAIQIGRALQRQDLAAAESLARELIKALPWAPDGHRLLATVMIRAGKPDDALNALEAAARAGDNDASGVEEDLDFAPLRDDPRFVSVLERLRASPGYLPRRPAVPAPARRRAIVDETNLEWDAAAGQLVAHWLPAPIRKGTSITDADDAIAEQLRAWWEEGTAAGNTGDLYDNRDSGHSSLSEGLFPQSSRIIYRLAARDAYLHDALPENIRHQGPVVVIGNASEAEVTGPFRRSLPRRALVQPRSAARLAWQYANNQIYVYPACFDFMKPTEHNGYGDAFPALTPYLIASIGYSGSDQDFLNAIFTTLAALRPEVKRHLLAERQIAPVVQMILRRCLNGIDHDDAYLTARAHPAGFAGPDLRPGLMAAMAHDLTLATLPPTISLRVLEEDAPAQPGRDFFDAPGRSEILLNSPAAIARVMRSARQQSWRLLVRAEAKGRPLTVRWAVLRGMASVTTRDDGATAEIIVPWQERHDAGGGSGLETDRIDILCAAHDGLHWSAPAFVSFYAPAHETRSYLPDGRIASVVYTGADEAAPYTDPMVCLPKSWRDDYHWDEAGHLLGWTRTRGKVREEFDSEGRLRTENGTVAVRYRVELRGERVPIIVGSRDP